MAEIKTSIDYQLDLTVHTVTGSLLASEILAKLETYYRGKPTALILWDFLNATLSEISSEELLRTIKKAKVFSRKGGKTALVFSQEVDFGIGRMLEVLAQMEGYDYVFSSFRSINQALEWLGEGKSISS